jgi:hypothetical protein
MTEEHSPRDEADRGGSPPGSFTQDIQHTPVGARIPEETGRGVFCNATMILQTNEEFVVDFLSTLSQPQQVVARVVLTPSTFSQVIGALRENVARYEERFGHLIPREPTPPPATHTAGPLPAVSTPHPEPADPGTPAAGAGVPPLATPPAAPAGAAAGHHEHHARGPAETSPQPPQPRIEDLYEQLKLPERLLGGTYANVVLIRHMAEEFSFDFIANFFPRSIVVSRVFFPAGRIPSFLDAMTNSLQIFRRKYGGGGIPPGAHL